MRKTVLTLTVLVVLGLMFTSSVRAQTPEPASGLLAKVQARGKLICGINGTVQGFSYVDPKTKAVSGFDTDFCRVIAAAVLGKADAVDFQLIKNADRFTALQNGDVDVLIATTTYSFDRDTRLGANFGPTTFYDGQTLMARVADKLAKLEDLKDTTICAIKGTTSEQNIRDAMAALNLKATILTFDDSQQMLDWFVTNRCDAVTDDRSGLVSDRAKFDDPSAYMLFEQNLSKEPLSPVYKAGDAQWAEVVRWAVFATIIAEENGISSKNVDDMLANSKNAEVRRLLGADGELYKNLAFDKAWAYNVIKQVGNYGEIYDRNLGPTTPFNLPRGFNDLWTKGGLIYAPPYR